MLVGANVRAELGRANRSQTWLGDRLGVTQASVSLRLSGRIALDITELVRIAEALNVPLSRLLDGVAVSQPIGAAS